jgi:hypothetical protein
VQDVTIGKIKMKRIILLCVIAANYLSCLDRPLKVLHMTFHNGCKEDFIDVAQELDLDLTSWYVQSLPQNFWEGFNAGNGIYNVTHERAARVWDRHKDFFNTFDVIVTSDTAPLSRIFLQNGWNKPLIIWVCNRFDYGVEGDTEYYELLRKATHMNNVKIIAYTPYEHVYMQSRGISSGNLSIKPLGKKIKRF